MAQHSLRAFLRECCVTQQARTAVRCISVHLRVQAEIGSVMPLRELFLMYKNYADETKAWLAEIENHMKIIAAETMKPI